MSDPVSVTRNGHRTYFKWHRARRRASDPVFTGRRILEGMALGASVEVDLVIHGSNGFAVLHNHNSLNRETTGTGPAKLTSGAEMRSLRLRDNDGEPIADRVMLLEDLCELLRAKRPAPGALLQLDFKENQGQLEPATIKAFNNAVTPVAAHMILSSGEAESVAALAADTPGLHIGHDPCHQGALERLAETRDFRGFVAKAIADVPTAEMIYLAWPMVLAAGDAGIDVVAMFHAANRKVDAYTIKIVDAETLIVVQRLLSLKVDQITTDDSEGLAALLEANP